MYLRILVIIILLVSVFYFPFWISAILAFAIMMYFPLFFEAIFIFLLTDLLYGVRGERFLNFVFVSLVFSITMLFVAEILKKKLKFYP